jgi:long-subunit fatty acid transport protein
MRHGQKQDLKIIVLKETTYRAIEKTVAAGFTYHFNDQLNFGGRLRYFGSRPLIEDNSVRSDSSTLVNLQGSYQFNKNFQAQLELFNVFDQKLMILNTTMLHALDRI